MNDIFFSLQTNKPKGVQALILAPSKELCSQIYSNIVQLTCKCSREVSCVDISSPVGSNLNFSYKFWNSNRIFIQFRSRNNLFRLILPFKNHCLLTILILLLLLHPELFYISKLIIYK